MPNFTPTSVLRYLLSHTTVPGIKIPGFDSTVPIAVHFARHHALGVNTTHILEAPNHPLYERVRERWETRTDPLWWNCIVSIREGGKKRVIRGWLVNRTRAAFKASLKDRGYDSNGNRILEAGPGKNLIGTVHLTIKSPMLYASGEQVKRATDLIVAEIERRQKSDKRPGKSKPRNLSKESPEKTGLNELHIRY